MNKEQQIAIMLNGKGAMPTWKQLSDVELAAVATYVKNSWGNSAGSAVQPAEFAAALHVLETKPTNEEILGLFSYFDPNHTGKLVGR